MDNVKYLIRLDDACPYMDATLWEKVEAILDKYSIRPLVGIIPDNRDADTRIQKEDENFWEKARKWQSKGWQIALHGYDHCCNFSSGGLNPVHQRSEFADKEYDIQKEKLIRGFEILTNQGLKPTFFFAPSHTYDKLTLRALVEVTGIRKVSDTFTRFPYKYNNSLTIYPCQMGKCRKIPIKGFWTFCLHPNLMNDDDLEYLEHFISDNLQSFISYDNLPKIKIKKIGLIDRLLKFTYIRMRKLR